MTGREPRGREPTPRPGEIPRKRPWEAATINELPEEAAPKRLYLLVIGRGVVATHPLPDSGRVTLGRSVKNDVQLDDPSISRHHAVLHIGPPLTLEDAGSANGTRVRGERLSPGRPEPLASDEVAEVGSALIVVQHRSEPIRAKRLWTHDYFEGRLEEECARAETSSGSFSLARLHCNVSMPGPLLQAALADTLGPLDIIGLYAPGEYEVLLTTCAPEEAAQTVRRALDRLGDRAIQVNVGIAGYPRDGRSPDSLMAHAGTLARGEPPTEPLGGAAARSVMGTSGPMQQLYRVVERIAAGSISVVILGETGVGKEVVAEAIHRLSPRAEKPFLRLNCAALSETLLESELFGHERGAFTGAAAPKQGLLETADGGTVLLDEVGELPLALQAKLLRVIEQRQVLRVGGLRPRAIDVRFVAATNRDLEQEVIRGNFRQDLFFRLNGVMLVIPPLRERIVEIEPLAREFIREVCRKEKRRPEPVLSVAALDLMERYGWPGNIRELRNVIERAVLLCTEGVIGTEHLPVEKMRASLAPQPKPTPRVAHRSEAQSTARELDKLAYHPADAFATPPGLPAEASPNIRAEMAVIERMRILEALDHTAGNQTQAARLLGMSRRTLVNRLNDYEIVRPRKGR